MERGRVEMHYGTCPPDWSAGVLYVGREACRPGHSWQGVRDHYLLHYVTSGRGIVRAGRTAYELDRGDIFLYAPGEYLHYTADETNPWSYLWVGFGGIHADALVAPLAVSAGKPVISMPYAESVHDTLTRMLAAIREPRTGAPLQLTGLLYQLFAMLAERRPAGPDTRTTASDLVEEAQIFIAQNYQREIDVGDVIRHIGVDRSHFSRVFRARTGVSLRDYLIRIRMERARRLIRETDLPVRAVAASVGYRNYPTFERRYRAHFGCAPTATRSSVPARRSGAGS